MPVEAMDIDGAPVLLSLFFILFFRGHGNRQRACFGWCAGLKG
jgi:hypothetical protein